MTSKSDIFVQEFVLGFGFLGGLFTWVGVDPEEEVIRVLLRVAIPNNEALVSLAIVLAIVVSTAAGILGTLQMSGPWGLLVVGIAWVSGFIISISSLAVWGVILLIVVLISGQIVLDRYGD